MSEQAQGDGAAGERDAGPLLIGYDGSDGARRAIRRAAALFPAREAIVVTARLGIADAAPELTLAPGGLLVAAAESLSEVMEERAQALAAEGAQLAEADGLRAEARTVRSHRATWEGITRCAEASARRRRPQGSARTRSAHRSSTCSQPTLRRSSPGGRCDSAG